MRFPPFFCGSEGELAPKQPNVVASASDSGDGCGVPVGTAVEQDSEAVVVEVGVAVVDAFDLLNKCVDCFGVSVADPAPVKVGQQVAALGVEGSSEAVHFWNVGVGAVGQPRPPRLRMKLKKPDRPAESPTPRTNLRAPRLLDQDHRQWIRVQPMLACW